MAAEPARSGSPLAQPEDPGRLRRLDPLTDRPTGDTRGSAHRGPRPQDRRPSHPQAMTVPVRHPPDGPQAVYPKGVWPFLEHPQRTGKAHPGRSRPVLSTTFQPPHAGTPARARPTLSLRTGNLGFQATPTCRIDNGTVDSGNDVPGGSFMKHHGPWQADSTRGVILHEMKDYSIFHGVRNPPFSTSSGTIPGIAKSAETDDFYTLSGGFRSIQKSLPR